MAARRLNVFGKPLKLFNPQPIPGFAWGGYCGPNQSNMPTVAAILTDEFLSLTKPRGYDLRKLGLMGGDRWCVDADQWLFAHQTYYKGGIDSRGVPYIDLDATDITALEKIELNTLRNWATVWTIGRKGGKPHDFESMVNWAY